MKYLWNTGTKGKFKVDDKNILGSRNFKTVHVNTVIQRTDGLYRRGHQSICQPHVTKLEAKTQSRSATAAEQSSRESRETYLRGGNKHWAIELDSKMNPAERFSGYLGGHFLITLSIQQSKLSIYEFFVHNQLFYRYISKVFLICQIWIVDYYVKSSENNLSNENIKTGVSREMIFQK